MKSLFLILAFLFTIKEIIAQNWKAERALTKMYFEKSATYFNNCYLKKPTSEKAEKLAICYRQLNQLIEYEYWLERAISKANYDPILLLYYADGLKMNGKYQEARIFYSLYGEIFKEAEEKARIFAESCTESLNRISNPENIVLTANPVINKSKIRHIPAEYAKEMIYIQGKIAGPGTFNQNRDTIYFTIITPPRKNIKLKREDHKKGLTKNLYNEMCRFEIVFASKKDDLWSKPERLFIEYPEISFLHPALSKEGNILYFASNMKGGMGGMDIYYCEKNHDGSWGKPLNAGNKINSEGDEIYPFISEEGIMYFSSDGHKGMGGQDIFFTLGSKNNWTIPENMGYPYNSPRDDYEFSFYEGTKSGYFTSLRENLSNEKTFFEFRLKPDPEKIVITGLTLKEDKQPLSGVFIEISGERERGPKADINLFSDAMGRFVVTIDRKSDYVITCTKSSYLERNAKIEVKESIKDTVQVLFIFEGENIFKNVIGPRKEFKANTIYYDLDNASIREDASIELDKIALIMLDNEDIKVEFSAHTDCRAGSDYNYFLSEKRAKSAVEYLINSGVDISRISAMAHGKTKIINKCKDGIPCNEDEHQENRRVEIKLIFEQNVPAKYTENEEHQEESKG
jgi:outer membrane protein OmpA-like peptidoglycan-associated protein